MNFVKIAWLTDIHLNFLSLSMRKDYYQRIKKSDPELVIITGDISEATTTCLHLEDMADIIERNVLFVAGNHDYYHGAVDKMRQNFDLVHGAIYLTSQGPICHYDLTIVGVDGWADAYYGAYLDSPVVLNDSRLIRDLLDSVSDRLSNLGYSSDDKQSLRAKMQELAYRDATLLKWQLMQAVEHENETIIIATHIPPFPENSMYHGEIADDNYLPFYTCRATGDVIMDFATQNPEKDFIVLCGHSHEEATYQPEHLPNLLVRTGASEYNKPPIKMLEF